MSATAQVCQTRGGITVLTDNKPMLALAQAEKLKSWLYVSLF